MVTGTHLQFRLPEDRLAAAPPEQRGTPRDRVRLLVADGTGISHSRFDRLPDFLRPGDLVVVNTSPTMPAALAGSRGDRAVTIHLSTCHDDGSWTVELRHPDQRGPVLDAGSGEVLQMGPGRLRLENPIAGQEAGATRLWLARIEGIPNLARHMQRHGKPIRYAYVRHEWPLAAYQNVFADRSRWPGSAEMASAGRPFTNRLLKRLEAVGVGRAAIELHAGVSSQESGEPPQAERFRVPEETARQVNQVRRAGGRIIAIGTTVTRALESAAIDGMVEPAAGWTGLVLGPTRPARVVDGLITGWHAPEASHLALLEAVAGPDRVAAAYRAALEGGYLWHEFGDSCLLLPGSDLSGDRLPLPAGLAQEAGRQRHDGGEEIEHAAQGDTDQLERQRDEPYQRPEQQRQDRQRKRNHREQQPEDECEHGGSFSCWSTSSRVF